jgi:hypothetical protein
VRFVRRRGNGVGVGVGVEVEIDDGDGDMIGDVLACWREAGLLGSAIS